MLNNIDKMELEKLLASNEKPKVEDAVSAKIKNMGESKLNPVKNRQPGSEPVSIEPGAEYEGPVDKTRLRHWISGGTVELISLDSETSMASLMGVSEPVKKAAKPFPEDE